MEALTEPEIRDSFANVTKGEAGRIPMPRDFGEVPWEDLDFLGWRDLGAPERAYLVARRIDGEPKGVMMRLSVSSKGFLRRTMCSLCYTSHAGDGVALMTARKAGPANASADAAKMRQSGLSLSRAAAAAWSVSRAPSRLIRPLASLCWTAWN